MPNPRYIKGAQFENDVVNNLQDYGYVTVRAAGSKGSGKVDIIAVRPDGAHLWIQCKTDGKISIEEWNRISQCASWIGATPILAKKSVTGKIEYQELKGVRVARQPGNAERIDVYARRVV